MWENKILKKRLLFAVFFVIISCPLALWSAQEDLRDIEDILDTGIKLSDSQGGATGQAFLESRVYEKTSLMTLSFPKSSGNYQARTYYFNDRNPNGLVSHTINGSGLNAKSSNKDHRSYFYGTPSAVTVSRDHGDSGAYRFAIAQYDGLKAQIAIGRVVSEDSKIQPKDIKNITFSSSETFVFASDISAGLFIDGEETESFAIGEVLRGGDDDVNPICSLYLRIVPGEIYDNSAAQTKKLELYTGSVSRYSAVRVAAGDFDGDGIASEVAVLFDAKTSSGTDNNYKLRIYKISRNNGVVEIGSTALYSATAGRSQTPDVCAHDIVAGDFDGDGKQEVAIVISDYNTTHKRATPTVQVYKRSGSGYTTQWTTDSNYDNHAIGGVEGLIDTYTHTCGILAEAADLDGDGKDEIVWTAPLYGDKPKEGQLLLSVWQCDSTLKPKEISTILTNYKALGRDFMPQNISLIASPLRNSMNTVTNRNNMQIGVAIREEGRDSRFYIHNVTTDAYGAVSGITNVAESNCTWFGSDSAAPVLLAADFADESLILGDPEHYVIEGNMSYNVILQTPPYHIDYIKAPWSAVSDEPSVQNFTYVSSTASSYKSVETQDDVFNYTIGGGLSGSIGAKGSIGLSALKMLTVSGGLEINAALSATYDYVNNSHTQKQNKAAMKTTKSDAIKYLASDYHVWRYPILGKASDSTEPSVSDDRTTYLQYSMSDTVVEATADGNGFDGYSPMHEEGNLFSYPVKLANTLGYPTEKEDILAAEKQATLGDTSIAGSLTWTQTDGTDKKLALSGSLQGSLSMNLDAKIPIEIGSFNAKVEDKWTLAGSAKYMPTWSTSIARTEELAYELSSTSASFAHSFDDVKYDTHLNAFKDTSGALALGYSVVLWHGGNNTARLWNSPSSPYVQLPDPALNLPRKFYPKSSGNQAIPPIWIAYDNEAAVHKMRGLSILTQEGENSGNYLIRGQTYRVECRVYNYSFVNAQNVDVEFYYQADENSVPVSVARKTVPKIPAWDGVNENKAMIEFDWSIPSDMATGSKYRLYAHIDPDGKIDEIHEDWDLENDPSGNNLGYVNFGVVTPDEARLSMLARGASERMFSVQLTNMSPEEFKEALSNDENVWVDGVIAYEGKDVITNVRVDVFDGEYTTERTNVLMASRHFPAIFPGESKNFHFLLQPDILRGRKLVIKIRGNGLPYSDERTVSINLGDSGGGSSGCAASPMGALATLLLAVVALTKRR